VVQTDPRQQHNGEARQRALNVTFLAELDERIPALNRALARLERSAADAPLRDGALGDLFREAHNLKAAARVVDQSAIEHVASTLEATLAAARHSGSPPPPPPWFDAAYALVDSLSTLRAPSPQANTPADPASPDADAPNAASRDAVARGAEVRGLADGVRGEAPGRRAGGDSVRVSVDKLDALLMQAGELTVAHIRVRQRQRELRSLRDDLDASRREWRQTRGLRATLRRTPRPSRQLEAVLHLVDQAEERSVAVLQRIDELSKQLGRDTAQLGLVTHAVEEEVMAVRLLPLATVSTLLERTLRDLVRTTRKEVELVIEGGETTIDRKILEQLRDPLMHMLRNAVDHGIEPPELRVASGKPRTGTVRLAAAVRGGFVEIDMSDDGIGLNPLELRNSAVRKGLLSAEQAAATDDAAIADIIFQPGFSTRATVTELSGRGVGLDVVRQHVEQLNGQVMARSQPGRGSLFTLRVPLTLATTRAILLEEGGQLLALPSTLIERSARVRQRHIVTYEGRLAVNVEGRPVPAVELASVLQRPPAAGRQPDDWRQLVILQQGDRRIALLTDRLVGEQEIVVKSLGWPLRRAPNVSGAAVLGSGETVVILNPNDLFKNGVRLAMAGHETGGLQPGATVVAARVRRLLAVDDSLTTRTLLRSILESAGYDVAVAADGLEAMTLLHERSIDLVVADVEMPRMDGYELTAAIRRDERLRQTPVVLVTSLNSREHRERGVAAGADAYIVKAEFAQGHLLDTVGRLL
jgi:two-component system chemotaxis sensor kinase CheA